jgi:hypothetical protein
MKYFFIFLLFYSILSAEEIIIHRLESDGVEFDYSRVEDSNQFVWKITNTQSGEIIWNYVFNKVGGIEIPGFEGNIEIPPFLYSRVVDLKFSITQATFVIDPAFLHHFIGVIKDENGIWREIFSRSLDISTPGKRPRKIRVIDFYTMEVMYADEIVDRYEITTDGLYLNGEVYDRTGGPTIVPKLDSKGDNPPPINPVPVDADHPQQRQK